MASQARFLFVFTSAEKTLRGNPTGYWLSEAAHPYYVLAPHFAIDFAAPKGPNPPVAPASTSNIQDDAESTKFLVDPEVKERFAKAKKLDQVNVDDYVAVYYPGGHGPVLDLATDPMNIALANKFWRAGKVVAADCHGPAALVGATDAHGKSIFAGRRASGFTNVEEEKLGTVADVPFSTEDRLIALGAKYEKVVPFGSIAVVDGKLITGQNPASAVAVGQALLNALS
ncbi:class I glutamine amidotransferase-like protein [Auricularia subglabra TFB-10046 SS5]|nr:class I glutamine amidotransferase-like protein [Auricularia subglabra TFB-10046 SS5]